MKRGNGRAVHRFNLIAVCLAAVAILALFVRARMVHFEYPDGNAVHVLANPVTLTSDSTGDRILFHGRLPQYLPSGSVTTDCDNRLHMVVELEDLHDSDELLIEVWNANMEARIDGKLIGTYLDGNPIHSLSSYYYSIPMDHEYNGKILTVDYWRERRADIPWTFPQLKIGSSSELFHHVYFPYRLMLILASVLMYSSMSTRCRDNPVPKLTH